MNLTPVNIELIERKISQTDLAKRLQIDRGHLCRVINGRLISNPTRHRIAKALKKNVNELWPENN